MPRPIILGVVGDSAAGKTTMTRGLVRILGEQQVTAVSTDDYHRYDRKQRAERRHHAAASGLQLRGHHVAASAPPAPRRADPQARVCPLRRHLRPPGLRRSRSPSRSSRACSATTAADLLRLLRRPRLPGATGGPAPRVEGSARHLPAGVHHRSGAQGARQARSRLGGVHPPPGAPRGHGRLRSAHATATATPTHSTREHDPARQPATSRPVALHRRGRSRHHAATSAEPSATSASPARWIATWPPRSRRRSGKSCTSPHTYARTGWASTRSEPTCTARSRWRSCSS